MKTVPSITTRVVSGAAWMMGWRLVSRFLGFISILALARLLVPADFGLVAIATSVTASIDGLSQIGVRDALIRLQDEQRATYDTAFTLQVARAVLTAGLILLISTFAMDWFGDPRLSAIFRVLAAISVLSGFENVGTAKLSRKLDFRTIFVLQATPRLAGFIVTTGLAFATQSYWALIIGSAVGKLCGVILGYVAYPHWPRFSVSGWRYLLHFSFWTWAGSLAITVWSRSDPFLLGPVLGTAVLGVYMIAGEIAILPVTELIEPACSALFPGFALAQRSGTNTIGMGLSIAGALALLAIPFSIGVSACSGYLVASLLGSRWSEAQPVIAILAWLCLFSPFSYVAGTVLSAQGQVRRVFVSNAVAAGIKVLTVLAVRNTLNLRLIAMVAVATVGVESSLFIGQLRAAGNSELRELAAAMARAAISGLTTCAVLLLIPGTWGVVTDAQVSALIEGSMVGLLTFAIFAACQTALWRLSGSPAGPERRLADLVRDDARLSYVRSLFPAQVPRV